MTTSAELRRSIQAQLAQLEKEAVALRRALDALGGPTSSVAGRPRRVADRTTQPAARAAKDATEPDAAVAAAPRGRAASTTAPPAPEVTAPAPAVEVGPAPATARAGRRRAGSGRPSVVVPAEKLVTILADEHDGLTTAELATRANGERDQILVLLRELQHSGEVRRSGERRATRWHRITDEDRIAQRVAELEAQSAAARAAVGKAPATATATATAADGNGDAP